MAGILEGVKVVELGHWVAIPSACAILSDWGAEVIKIEDPGGGDALRGMRSLEGVTMEPVHFVWELCNRNKKSLAVDLRREEGREVVYRLVKEADVFLSNFQPAVLERFRMDYTSLSRINPGLVYGVLTGYGRAGPDREKPGYDYSAFWARSGIMDKIGEPESPPPPQRPGLGDNTTAMLVAGAVAAALFHKQRTGKGQELHFSLFNTAVWALSIDIQVALAKGVEIPKTDRRRVKNPLWNTYRTGDGRWLQFVMIQSDRFWPRFCRAIGKPELENDPRFNSQEARERNCEELISIISRVIQSRTLEEWERILTEHELIFSRVQSVSEVIADPQARENEFFAEVEHPVTGRLRLVASPVKFSQNPPQVRSRAPELGEHTEEILLGLGYSWEDIARLKESEVII